MNVNALFNPRRGGRSINPHSRRPAVCLYLLLVAVVAVGFLALTPGNAAAHGHNITVEEPTAIEGGTLTFAIKGAAGARGTLRYELVGWGGSGPMGDVLAAGAAKLSQDYFTPGCDQRLFRRREIQCGRHRRGEVRGGVRRTDQGDRDCPP